MTEFVDQIRLRVTDALTDLAQARAAGDDYRVQVHTGELESFARLAEENGVRVLSSGRSGQPEHSPTHDAPPPHSGSATNSASTGSTSAGPAATVSALPGAPSRPTTTPASSTMSQPAARSQALSPDSA